MKMAPSGALFGKTRCCGARVVIAPDEPGQTKRGGAGFRKARTYENRRAATQGDELGRGIGPASPAGPYIVSSSVERERPLPRAMGL